MDTTVLKKIWKEKYQIAAPQFEKISNVQAVATGFNTNIDAVCHMSGESLSKLIADENLSLKELENIDHTAILTLKDFIKGVFKAFRLGIAEEWICEDEKVYELLKDNLKCGHLQIGGQGGIMANALSTVGVQKVFVHTNSLPKLQADQFVKCNNLISFDEKGKAKPAHKINRKNDLSLIHFIIDFKRGDVVIIEGKKFRCPRANRFIATYDPLNLNLVLDESFMKNMLQTKLDFVFLSGFHALLSKKGGIKLIKAIAKKIKSWKKENPETIFHLEIASTQDVLIRRAIAEQLVPLMDSIGINERETIDLLHVLDFPALAKRCDENTTAENLLKALAKIKEKTGVKRVQLHMFGLYMTLQDKNFPITAKQNLAGMLTAAVVGASKAKTGSLEKHDVLEIKPDVSDVGLIELESLAILLDQPNLITEGIGRYISWDLIAVPTILIENPISLVGMGDTISSVSLVAARS